jgi:hypothetical protein
VFRLDRPGGLSYLPIGLAGAVIACAGGLKSIAPADLHSLPVDSVRRWEAAFRPDHARQYDLRWKFENRDGRAAGRAVARFAPPDTLRFDYRGPFGRSGSALVVGNAAVWSEPEGDIDRLVPVAPILWAALGITTALDEGSELLGSETAQRRAWRYVAGDRELDYLHIEQSTPRLLAELRELGSILGFVEVQLAPGSTQPVEAVMQFPQERSKFSLTVRQVDSVAAFPAATWRRP